MLNEILPIGFGIAYIKRCKFNVIKPYDVVRSKENYGMF